MAERVQRKRVAQPEQPQVAESTNQSPPSVDYDAILDQIDAVLEADAETYVRSFVQKGGQ